jgi:hypothetical protein
MISEISRSTAERARLLYDAQLRQPLERDFPNQFVCIEPDSGRHFIAETFDAAVSAALDAFPDRLTYTIRISHSAAIHLGVFVQ